MMRWLGLANRGALALVALLCVAAASPVAAQQDSLPTPQPGASEAPASAASTLAGPRLRPEWRGVEPNFRWSSGAGSMAASGGGSHTITITTLVLVLLIIIVVLLV